MRKRFVARQAVRCAFAPTGGRPAQCRSDHHASLLRWQANQEQEDAERDGWLLRYPARAAPPAGVGGAPQRGAPLSGPAPFVYPDGLAVYCGEWQASRRHGYGRLTLYTIPAAAKRAAAAAAAANGSPTEISSAAAAAAAAAEAAAAVIEDLPPLRDGEAAYYDGEWAEGHPEGAGSMLDPVGGAYAGER